MSTLPQRRALLVGVDTYDCTVGKPLANCRRDVENLVGVLSDPLIGAFDDVTPLYSPTLHEMAEGLVTFFSESHKNDLLFFYYSGHGLRTDRLLGQLILTCRDTKLHTKLFTGVGGEQIRKLIDLSGAKRVIITLDCCYSGSYLQPGKAGEAEEDWLRETHELLRLPGEQHIVITATQAAEKADTGEAYDMQLSLFTHYLVDALKEGADVKDRECIYVDDVYEYIRRRIPERQKPMLSQNRKEGEPLCLALHPHEAMKRCILQQFIKNKSPYLLPEELLRSLAVRADDERFLTALHNLMKDGYLDRLAGKIFLTAEGQEYMRKVRGSSVNLKS